MPNENFANTADLANYTATAAVHEPNKPKRGRRARTTSASPSGELNVRNAVTNGTTKADIILTRLSGSKGATMQVLMEATGWQAHSVRGLLSGTVKKKLGHAIVSEIGKDGIRRYRIVAAGVGA